MAAYTITNDQTGVYEVPLVANTVSTVTAAPGRTLTVLLHTGASPVYAKEGTTVSVQDQTSIVVPPGTWATIPNGSIGQLALISASAATVSVYYA